MVNQLKANGLSSRTKFYEWRESRSNMEYHEHPQTGELVVLRSWWVPDGEDDVAHEFEIFKVYPPVACELAKLNKKFLVKGKHYKLSI